MATATEARIEDRLTVAFEQEERAAWMLVVRVRLWAGALIAAYALLWDQSPVQLFWAACGLLFGLLGPLYRVFARSRLGGPWQGYLFVTADAVLRGRDGRIRLWALAPHPAKAVALPLP